MVTRKKIGLEPVRVGGKEVGRVLITGASAGIGAELARHRHRLTLVARRRAMLAGLVDLNVRALTELTSRLLPSMIERGFGRVLNVSSLAAFQPVPSMAAYAASKAYVLSLTEALSEELRGTGVKVTALCPGLTETNMVTEIKERSASARALPKQFVADPRDVAVQAYKALMSGQVVLVPGLPNQVTAAWAQVTPRWLTRYVAGLAARQTDWTRSK